VVAGVPQWQANAGPTAAYDEVPSGVINGVNDTFTLANAPSPTGSLMLFKSGLLMIKGGVDYSLSGSTITFVSGAEPATGENLICTYLY
jgi:hypothetical protein